MHRRTKAVTICSALSLAGAIAGLRTQSALLLGAAIAVLLILAIVERSQAAVASASAVTILLFPGAQPGWLYGRDSHVTARNALQIQQNGWPVNQVLSRGFLRTPLIHFHGLMTSELTGLQIYPSVEASVLVSWLLPLFFTGVVLLFVYVITRQNAPGASTALMILPILAWTPLFYIRTGFRRPAIGLVFFTVLVWLVNSQLDQTSRARSVALAAVVGTALILAHHVASVIAVLFLVAAAVTIPGLQWLDSRTEFGRLIRSQNPAHVGRQAGFLALGFLVGITILYLFTGEGQTSFNLLAHIIFLKLGQMGALAVPTGTFESGNELISRFAAQWYFMIVVAIGVGLAALSAVRDRGVSMEPTTLALVWGALIGAVSVIGQYSTLSLGVTRLQTYFLILGGGVAIVGYSSLPSRWGIDRAAPKAVILCLIVLGAFWMPAHYVSDARPTYEEGISDQRYDPPLYATGDFATTYAEDQKLIGDGDFYEVVGSSTGRPVVSNPDVIRTQRVPNNSIVFLHSHNRYAFFGPIAGGWYFIRTSPNLFDNFDLRNDRVYSSGNVTIYS